MKKCVLAWLMASLLTAAGAAESFSFSGDFATGFFQTGRNEVFRWGRDDLQNSVFSSNFRLGFHQSDLLGAGLELDFYNQFKYWEDFDGTIYNTLLVTDPVAYVYLVSRLFFDFQVGIGLMAPSLGFADGSYISRFGDSFVVTFVPALRLNVGLPVRLTKQLFLVPYVRGTAIGIPGVSESIPQIVSYLMFDNLSTINRRMHLGADFGIALEVRFE